MHIPTPERKSEIYDIIRLDLIRRGILSELDNPHRVLECAIKLFTNAEYLFQENKQLKKQLGME